MKKSSRSTRQPWPGGNEERNEIGNRNQFDRTTGGDFKGTINTLEVDDIDAAIAKILAHGGEIALEKHAIPGVGYQAYFKDNSGIIVGLHQADPKAGMGG